MSGSSKWTSNPSTIAGAGAGLVSSIVTCPLDVIKTKLQAQKTAKGRIGYLGTLGTVNQILVRDGLKGMYRGLGPTILGYLPTWAIYFSLYDGIKQRFGEDPMSHSNLNGRDENEHHSVRESMALHVSAAMTAGATGTIVTNPLWVIKTRFMIQPPEEARYRHTLDAFMTIYRREGAGAFYRGLVPSLLGVSHVAVQFPLYEELKRLFADRRHVPVSDLHSGTILVSSSISKMAASLVTYPHEVVRTRLQIDFAHPEALHSHPLSLKAIAHTVRSVVQESGWRGFYRGLSINLMRTVPNSGITLLTYELLMRQLTSRKDPH